MLESYFHNLQINLSAEMFRKPSKFIKTEAFKFYGNDVKGSNDNSKMNNKRLFTVNGSPIYC